MDVDAGDADQALGDGLLAVRADAAGVRRLVADGDADALAARLRDRDRHRLARHDLPVVPVAVHHRGDGGLLLDLDVRAGVDAAAVHALDVLRRADRAV